MSLLNFDKSGLPQVKTEKYGMCLGVLPFFLPLKLIDEHATATEKNHYLRIFAEEIKISLQKNIYWPYNYKVTGIIMVEIEHTYFL